MNFKKYKPTFLSVIAVAGIILGIPFGIYCTTLTGGASLGAVVVFAIVIGLALLLAVDRILVNSFDPKKLSWVEFFVTLVFLVIFWLRAD